MSDQALNFPTFRSAKEVKVHHLSVRNLHKFKKNAESSLPKLKLVDENYAEISWKGTIGIGSRLIKKNYNSKPSKIFPKKKLTASES